MWSWAVFFFCKGTVAVMSPCKSSFWAHGMCSGWAAIAVFPFLDQNVSSMCSSSLFSFSGFHVCRSAHVYRPPKYRQFIGSFIFVPFFCLSLIPNNGAWMLNWQTWFGCGQNHSVVRFTSCVLHCGGCIVVHNLPADRVLTHREGDLERTSLSPRRAGATTRLQGLLSLHG